MPTMNVSGQTTVRWPQIIAGLSAAGGAFAVGAALGWPAPAQPRLVDEDQSFPISDDQFAWIASIITIGCAISCLPIGFLMKKFGRKWTMLSLVVPFIVGWSLVIWAQNFLMLLSGRFIIGLAGGAFCVSAPQYSSEIAEKEVRGILGTFFQLLINGGILFVYIVGAYMPIFWTNVICGIVPLVFGAIFFFMPESPVYLVIENREDEAIETYKWLRGSSYNPQDEVDELKEGIRENEINQVSLTEVFKRKSTIRALIIGFGLMFFQQMSGINVVIFFATFIFNAANTGFDSDVSTIIVGATNLIATFGGTLLVDKVGRKVLLLTSITVMTLCLIALGVFFFILETDEESAAYLGWLPLTSLCIYIIFFAIGYGPIPWLMLSEIYSKDYNAIASPITGAFNWILAFAITSTFNPLGDLIGFGPTFWIFAGISMLGTIFTFFFVPETKGKSFADIQRMLAGDKTVN